MCIFFNILAAIMIISILFIIFSIAQTNTKPINLTKINVDMDMDMDVEADLDLLCEKEKKKSLNIIYITDDINNCYNGYKSYDELNNLNYVYHDNVNNYNSNRNRNRIKLN